jgi:uncharacterized protein YciI
VVVKTVGVEFFCYHRDRPGSLPLREQLLEQHWSYMDRYQAEMIARGPTVAADGDTPTGSVHILNLAGPAAARAFAFDEPNYQAGIYRDVLLRRWRHLAGNGTADPGTRSGQGTLHLDPGPVRRHRSAQLAIRRAALMSHVLAGEIAWRGRPPSPPSPPKIR